MRSVVMLWLSSLAVMAAGALAVCPDGRCGMGNFDRGGLGLAHALRSGWLDAMMQGVTWLGSLSLLLPLSVALAGLLAAMLIRDRIDSVLIIVVTALVLVAEIMNSAIEARCDSVETRHDEKIGIIKDIAAAGVGIALLAWVLVLGFELEEMLRSLI